MEYMGCKEAAFDAVQEASKEFGGGFCLACEKYGKLDEICALVDETVTILGEEFECSEVAVEVDRTTKELIFHIVCDEIILQHGSSHKFFTLMRAVDSVRFSKAKPDGLRIDIGVAGLWVRR